MPNILPRERQIAVLHHLLEGNTLRSTTRLTHVHRTTSQHLLVDFGKRCRAFMDRELRGLTIDHIEIDEIWTFVGRKQARLTTDEKQERHDIGDIFVWYGIDQVTKLAPSFVVGKRSADNARRLMMDLRSRLVVPNATSSDARNYGLGGYVPIIQISTDGFSAYPEAVDLAFGPYAKFGTIVKDYRNAKLPYTPSEMVGTRRRGRRGIESSDIRSICTSHVERANLTMRTLMKRFTRLSLGFSKKLENLEAACAMFFAYYNFCWRTRHTDYSGQRGRLRPTAAMMSHVTDRLWSFEDLFEAVRGEK
jgi:IS1 family transposase